MGGEQAIERVPCPTHPHGGVEPRRRRRIVHHPALVVAQLSHGRCFPKPYTADLEQELDLQEAGWRDVELTGDALGEAR
jgi:hypothetical protein